jgi:hypothetical protein
VALGDDCDDDDALVYPGAEEHCDGADEDCDGEVDEQAVDATAWYPDADSDGFGEASAGLSECSAPPGYTAEAGDCDDDDDEVYPGAVERCDGRDDDCDGEIDAGELIDGNPYYADADGDGHGNPEISVEACFASPGWVPNAEDCDDEDAEVSPEAVEVCNGKDDDCAAGVDVGASDPSTWYLDFDGDLSGGTTITASACTAPAGYVGDSGDCNDADAAVHPGATELCNAVDDNCDGEVDEDSAADATAWFADGDGDGYGDAGSAYAACLVPAGYVADAADCDDTDAGVNPGADELCDGSTDEDCDGDVDEDDAADASTWAEDLDGDGYGDPSTAHSACVAAAGEVADDTDCDDADSAVNPGEMEDCATTADDDCDGEVSEDCWPSAMDATYATYDLVGTAGDYAGTQVEGQNDITGDGIPDLVVSGNVSGKMWIVPGPLTGDVDLGTAWQVNGAATFGTRLSADGDLDGDGINDLAVRTYSTGDLAVYYGRADWSAPTVDLAWSTYGAYTGDILAVDLDDSGTPDLIGVGASAGSLAIRYDPAVSGGSFASGAVTITDNVGGAEFPWGVAAWDSDGDGLSGVVAGTYHADLAFLFEPAPSASTTTTAADATWTEAGSDGLGGESVSFDADGDGYDDLLLGSSQTTPANSFLMAGGVGAVASGVPSALATTTFTGPAWAASGLCAADLDNDGVEDLLVGQHYGLNSWLAFGPFAAGSIDLQAAPVVPITTAQHISDQHFQDCTGALVDGYPQGVAVGAAYDSTGGTNAGIVHVFLPQG